MASFTDRSPATFTPYIPQKPVEAMVSVGLDREQRYAIGVQKVQEQLNNVSSIQNSLLRPEGKEYLSGKLNSVVNEINSSVGDLSNANVFNALIAKATEVGQDKVLNIELQNSLRASNKMRAIEELKEKKPELYSQLNEEYAMEDVHNWLNSGAPVGSTFIDRKPFSPYYDYNKEIQDSIKNYLSNPNSIETIDSNTGLVTKKQGGSPQELKNYLNGVLSEKAKQQMKIEGYVMGNKLSDETILGIYNSAIKEKEELENLKIDQLQQIIAQPASKLTDAEKTLYANEIVASKEKLKSLANDRVNSSKIASVLANRGDFYSEMFLDNNLSRIANASTVTKISYDTNQAVVQKLNRDFNQKMDIAKHNFEVNKFKDQHALAVAKHQLDVEYKNAELALRRENLNNRNNNVFGRNRGPGGINGSSYLGLSPNEYYSQGKSLTVDVEEKGDQGYNRFSRDTENLYKTYGEDKLKVINKIMEDPLTRREIVISMGLVPEQASSIPAFVAAPTEGGDIYNKYMMMDPDVLRAVDNYLISKNEQFTKGEKVGKFLEDFFKSTNLIKADIESRESFDKKKRDRLKSNLNAIDVKPIEVNGEIISVDDMLDYIAKGSNPKINRTLAERVTQTTIPGGGTSPTTTTRTHKAVIIDPRIERAINRIKDSQSYKEYKNNFNESFGYEEMISTFNFDLSDKKDKDSKQEFEGYASQIASLWNSGGKNRQINSSEIEPNFTIDRTTGEVTFSYSQKNNGKVATFSNNKVVIPSFKNQLLDSDKRFAQMLVYGEGSTPPIPLNTSKSMNVSIVSSSNDKKSQYTVNTDGTPAKYFLRYDNGEIINDGIGGFFSATEALNWITTSTQKIIDEATIEHYIKLSTDPRTSAQFNSLSEYDQSVLLDKYIESLDVKHLIGTISSNRTLNMVRDLKSLVNQKYQNQRQ